MCAAGLWTKLHKRRISARGDRAVLRAAALRSRPNSALPACPDDSMDEVETTAASAVFSSSPSASSSPPKTALANSTAAAAPEPERGVAAREACSGAMQGVETLVVAPPVELSLDAPPPASKPKRQLVLLPSVFEGRPPVLFFCYTAACGAQQRPMERAVYADIDGPRLFYSHTDDVHEYNAVINIMRQGGLYRVKADSQRWMLLWSRHPPPEVMCALRPTQRTNHFPGSWNLGRKDLLWKNIARMQRVYGQPYTITPNAFVLPKAWPAFDAARRREPDALWIWKPCSQSCGRGIKVVSSNLTDAEVRDMQRKRGIIQRYVHNPLLIEGYKFDLRIYVVVLSYDPLKVYINDEGLVRLATVKYSTDPSSLEQRCVHLTNYSVNKLSAAFVQNKDGRDRDDIIKRRGAESGAAASTATTATAEEQEGGEGEGDDGDGEGGGAAEAPDEGAPPSKWSLTELRENFAQRGLDYNMMLNDIKDVVIKTLLAVEKPMREEWSKALDDPAAGWLARGPCGAHSDVTSSCFETYGFDILVDEDLKAWLLEVNICPSLSSGSPLDKRIKTKLVADTLTVAGIQPPPNIWRKTRGSIKRAASDVVGMAVDDSESSTGTSPALAREELERRSAALAACEHPLEAIALFDELAWELVLEAHDQDMRSGGLERIYPTSTASQYVEYMEAESYCNLVLRKWYEAGGGALFGPDAATAAPTLPPWVPRQVAFGKT